VLSRFKEEADEDGGSGAGVDIEKILRSEEDQWRTRDEITVTLAELKAAAAAGDVVHTGRFGGQFSLVPFVEDQPVDRGDAALTAAVGDEIVATFTDELHVGGTTPRTVTAVTTVASEIDSKPRAVQYEVGDPVVAAKKSLV
jgi:hypothetical protein